MADLSQQAWAEQLKNDDNAVVIDVRTDAELQEGYIPHDLHLDIFKADEFMNGLKTLDPAKNYYVYCRSGNRSGQACAIMNQLGIKNAYNLAGGFMEWTGPSQR